MSVYHYPANTITVSTKDYKNVYNDDGKKIGIIISNIDRMNRDGWEENVGIVVKLNRSVWINGLTDTLVFSKGDADNEYRFYSKGDKK